MADRKISELSEATRVFDKDYMVVVTGIGQYKNPSDLSQGFVDYITTRVPLSGMATWTFRVNEVASGCSGIQVIPHINTGLVPPSINKITICTTGVSFTGHTHVSNDITNFGSSVSGLVEQRINFLNSSVTKTGTLTDIGDLSMNLSANTKYLCELGLIVSGTSSATRLSGIVSSTGIAASNNSLLNIYGTWNYIDTTNKLSSSTSSSVSGTTLIASGINNGDLTIVNKFTVSTFVTESDRLVIKFGTNNTDGAIKAGSWLKAEKVI
jgi:hypothetical protein